MPLIRINDTNLFYKVIGEGRPCFVLHGGLGVDHTCFRPWLDPLATHVQLVYVDLRGNGRSDRPSPDTLSFQQFSDDLDALREALGYADITLLGHSYGGFIALDYARRHPARVHSLILVDTVAVLDFDDEIAANLERMNPSQAIRAALQASPQNDQEFEQAMRTFAPLYFYRYDVQRANGAFQHIRWSLAANERGFELLSDYNMVAYLKDIRAPALCLSGEDDWLALPAQVQRLGAGLANATVVHLKQCGHFPFIEQPEQFLGAVGRWLQNVPNL